MYLIMSANRVQVVLLILGVTMLGPRAAPAMTVEMFDAMAIEDQQDYLELLVDRAREVFIAQRRQELAAKIEALFRRPRGQRHSPGAAEFEKQLTILRDYRSKEDVNGVRARTIPGDVEGALIGSIQKNGILMTHAVFKALSQAWTAKPYWPKRPLRTADSGV
jgi:hypothetical protein